MKEAKSRNSIRFHDAAEQEAFDRDGYFVRRIFDAATAERLKSDFFALYRHINPAENQASNYFSTLDPNPDNKAIFADMAWDALSGPFTEIARDWMMIQSSVLVKTERGSATAVHQHPPVTDRPFEADVVIWCPLQDCDETNGCLFVVPGSHRLYRFISVNHGHSLFGTGHESRIVREHAVAVPLKAGEALFFDNTLGHGAFANQNDVPRFAIGALASHKGGTQVIYQKREGCITAQPIPLGHYAERYRKDIVVAGEAITPLRQFPDWAPRANYEHIDALLRARGPRAREDYDPLDALLIDSRTSDEFATTLAMPRLQAEEQFPCFAKTKFGMNHRPVLKDPEAELRFRRDGYVCERLLQPDQISALLEDLSKLRPADGFDADGSGLGQNTYHCTFLDTDISYKRAAFECFSRHFSESIERHLAGYRIIAANVYVKQPGQGEVPIHQNWPTLDLKETSVTIWCPLTDVDVHNGTLHLWAGTHKLLPHIEGPTSQGFFKEKIANIGDYLTPIPLKAGEAVIFDDSLIHGSPPNLSDSPRIAVQIMCVPNEATPLFFHRADDERFEVIVAAPDFYIEQSLDDLRTRQPHWQSLGFVENRNRQVDETELTDLIRNGHELFNGDFKMQVVSDNVPAVNFSTRMRSLKARARHFAAAHAPTVAKRFYRRLRPLPPQLPLPIANKAASPIRDVRQPGASHSTVQVQEYYEEMTPAYLAGFGEIFQGSRPESTDELLEYLVDAIELSDGMTVLDAGCGVGGPAMALAARRNVKVYGLTLAHAQVEAGNIMVAERALGDRVSLRQGDFHKLSEIYPANSFDRVLFLESICHAEDYRTVLSGAHQVLKPGGALYIKDFYCIDNRARPSMADGQIADLNRLNEVYRLQLSDQASLVDLLSSLGFVIKYMRTPSYDPTYTHWATYEHVAGRGWHPQSAEPGDIIQAVEFFCWKR